MKERLRDFLLVKWDIPYKNLKILAGLWRSRNEILRSLENIVITRSIAIARLKCVSLTGILSRAICVAIVMEMLEVLWSTLFPRYIALVKTPSGLELGSRQSICFSWFCKSIQTVFISMRELKKQNKPQTLKTCLLLSDACSQSCDL